MGTRFLVTHIVDDPYKSGYAEYLVVNGEVFYRDIEETFPDDGDYPMQYAIVERCRLRHIPTVSAHAGTFVSHWYIYEPVNLSAQQRIPDSYAERVAMIFFGEDRGNMGSIREVE